MTNNQMNKFSENIKEILEKNYACKKILFILYMSMKKIYIQKVKQTVAGKKD